VAQGHDERGRLPMAVGCDALDPLAAGPPPAGRRRVGRGPVPRACVAPPARRSLRTVDEDQPLGVQLGLAGEPGSPGLGDVGSVRRGAARRAGSFSSREPEGEQGALHRHALVGEVTAQAVDGEVQHGGHQRAHALGVPRQRPGLASAHGRGRERAALTPSLHQLHHEADAHLVLCRHDAPFATARFTRSRRSLEHALGIHRSPPSPAVILRHDDRRL